MSSSQLDHDLTARARILQAALDLFGRVGYERATTRAIAEAAGVTSGLIRHHFGSKENLLAACDERIIEELESLADQTSGHSLAGYDPMGRLERYAPYLNRALVEGRARAVFEHAQAAMETWLRTLPGGGLAPVEDEAVIRTAMALSVNVLTPQISASFGTDVRSGVGERRLLAAVLQAYARPLIPPEQVQRYRAELGEVQ